MALFDDLVQAIDGIGQMKTILATYDARFSGIEAAQARIEAGLSNQTGQFSATQYSVDRLLGAFSSVERGIQIMSDQMTAGLTTVVADADSMKTVVEGATAAFTGLETRLAAAIADLVAKGVTPAQMAMVASLHSSLSSEKDALAAAVANVPADPNAPVPPVIPPAPTPTDPNAPVIPAPAPTDPNAPPPPPAGA